MAVSKKQQACVTRYMQAHYDQIAFRVPKGEKDRYKAIAESQGKSLNQFIIEAIEAKIAATAD